MSMDAVMKSPSAPAQATGGPDLSADAAGAYEFSSSLVTIANPQSRATEAIRALRTHIMAQHVHEGRRALAFCAPSAGAGCSFIAANLAVALSQTGLNTLLIDGDLRRPSIQNYIRPRRMAPGLAHYLATADADFGACVDAEVMPDLSVMYAGDATKNPQELLASERFKSLIDSCLRDFDVTIIDTPPANTYADARRISTLVGYALIVTGRDRTYVADVKTLAAQLQADHARVIGTVLNRA